MNRYQRLFGSGPTGALISVLLLVLAWQLEPVLAWPALFHSAEMALFAAALPALAGAGLLVWSLKSLPVSERGRGLVTSGVFRYLRHPFYAAFLSGFNIALALFMNNGIYLLWACLLHPVWHWHIRYEEGLMRKEFGDAYRRYCDNTGRFLPRFWTRGNV